QVTPTRGWRSAMTLPRELVLENTAKGPRLIQQLPNELQALREEPQEIEIGTTPSQVLNLSPQQLELMLRAAVDERSRTRFGFELTNEAGERYRIGYDAGTQNYFSDRRQAGKTDFSPQFADSLHLAPKQLEGALITMQLVFDRSSVELLADDGLVALTDCYFPNQDFTTITYFVDSTDVSIQRLEAWELEGIW
ncbi:MAG: glycoside hydrolase family 32 protein, partial [Bacteroidota bacterium]